MNVTVLHQSIQLDWMKPSEMGLPKTLILGSFNPYNPTGRDTVDYYYGRESNHLWRSIARIIGQNEIYFFDKVLGIGRKTEIMRDRFCCLDIIDKLNFISDSDTLLNEFLNKNIFSGYLDQAIWGSKINRGAIRLKRTYNELIIDTLFHTPSITKVIHTMGCNRMKTILSCKPKEAKLARLGFSGFIKEISDLCMKKGIEFNLNSLSPSGYAVKRGDTKVADLDQWLSKSLHLI